MRQFDPSVLTSLDDTQWITELYLCFRPLLFHTLRSYVDEMDVIEDLAQSVLERLIKKVATLRKLDAPALCSYITVSARNVALNYLRQKARRYQNEFIGDIGEQYGHIPTSDCTPEELLIMREKAQSFDKIFAELTLEEQDLLRGKYILNLNHKELAEMFECSPGAVRMRLSRLRWRIIMMLKEGDMYE